MTNVAQVLFFVAFIIFLVGLISTVGSSRPEWWGIILIVAGVLVGLAGIGLYLADSDNRAAELNRKQSTCTSQGYLWTQSEECFNKDGFRVVIP